MEELGPFQSLGTGLRERLSHLDKNVAFRQLIRLPWLRVLVLNPKQKLMNAVKNNVFGMLCCFRGVAPVAKGVDSKKSWVRKPKATLKRADERTSFEDVSKSRLRSEQVAISNSFNSELSY